MKICIDIRCLSQGRRTGVEEYTLNLLRHIFERDRKNEYILFLNSWKNSEFSLEWIKKYKNVSLKKFSIPNKILNFLFWFWDWPKIDKMAGGADIVYFPNIFFGSVSRKTKLVATIHDLSFERHPEYFSRKRRLWHYVINPKNICRRADKIITVSHSTMTDIEKLYGIGRHKIDVIYSGVSDKFKIISRNDEKLVKIKNKYALPYKYFLYLGAIEPRKNIISLIRAYNQFRREAKLFGNPELEKYKLIIAGEKGWLDSSIFKEIKQSEFGHMISYCGSISDSDKACVYNLASLFIYPSFFEGFGFPPLEAMKCGLPVICANNASLPEVAGNAAILIDPDRPDEIKTAMRQIALNQELREYLIKKGLKNAEIFGWKKTANRVIKIFNDFQRRGIIKA